MHGEVKQSTAKTSKRSYARPRLVTHGDVSKLTRKPGRGRGHPHDRWGPPSDISF